MKANSPWVFLPLVGFVLLAVLLASTAAHQAAAKDGAVYAGIEAGYLYTGDLEYELEDPAAGDEGELVEINHGGSYDLGIFVGYDFGVFRIEAEGLYRTPDLDNVELRGIPTAIAGGSSDDGPGALPVGDYTRGQFPNAGGETETWAGMLNILADIGDNDRFGFLLGGGAGFASVSQKDWALDAPMDTLKVERADGSVFEWGACDTECVATPSSWVLVAHVVILIVVCWWLL